MKQKIIEILKEMVISCDGPNRKQIILERFAMIADEIIELFEEDKNNES